MNIHLIRSHGFDKESYEGVLQLLKHFEGPLKFISSEEDQDRDLDTSWEEELDEDEYGKKKKRKQFIEEMRAPRIEEAAPIEFPVTRETATVDSLFELCNDHREAKDLGDEEFVILLTGMANELNWFSYGEDHINNIFIHTADWGYFVGGDLRFPITHQLATNILQKLMFGVLSKLDAGLHNKSIGCINDFCQHKKDITLKMRTADICADCQRILIQEKVPPAIINQVFNVLDGVRAQMLFKERFLATLQPSRMEVRGYNKRIYLTDMEDHHLHLPPLERALYLFFLDHPKGVQLNHLDEYEEDLHALYGRVSNAASDNNVAAMRNRIKSLVDLRDNSFHEKISKTNRRFANAVGEDMAEHYMILKDPSTGAYKIALDRKLLTRG